jgi:hypothetical protein
VDHQGEDQEFTGTIESMAQDRFVIGGRTFKVDAATILDGGLRQGVTAKVEFIKLSDDTMLAHSIETDAQDQHFTGTIDAISASQWKVGGQNFQVNQATQLDDGLAVGVMARVEFTTNADGSLLAMSIETDQDDEHFTGVIESISATSWKIGGKSFTVNTATEIDDGLAVGVVARIEFIKMTDGSLLAAEIETDKDDSIKAFAGDDKGGTPATGGDDKGGTTTPTTKPTTPSATTPATQEDLHLTGIITSMTTGSWIVGGQTFKVDQSTLLDTGLAIGVKATVEYIVQADGAKLARKIETGEETTTPGATTPATQEDLHFTGAIVSMGADSWVIGGQTFKVNAATMLDTGLVVGKQVKVDYIIQADSSQLAKKIETAVVDGGGGLPGY